MIDKSHPLYDTVRLVGSYTYDESRLIAEGNYSRLLERFRSHVQRQHYFHGLLQGGQGVLAFYWLSEFVRSRSTYFLVWAIVTTTSFAVDIWWWRKRRRAAEAALARLEREVQGERTDGGLVV